ncbi:MAG: pantoate--beta-alanine ligase [Pseudomonadota bacterium]
MSRESRPALPAARTVAALRARVAAWRAEGLRVGLTPTMGALHAGHLSLVEIARARADRVVATIFVNPTQFGPNEDFDAYPRDEAADAAKLAAAGCDLLFAPAVSEMYPDGFATEVRVRGPLTETLCGAARPGHFDGVGQVVSKLLNQAQADLAVFGEKDWQQLAVIRRVARDLDIPTQILGAPTLREADGLAMSSRNRYLSAEERAAAPALHRAIAQAAAGVAAGADPAAACAAAAEDIAAAGCRAVDYVEARGADDLSPLAAAPPPAPARVFAAAWLGRARLIDNTPIPASAGAP